MSDCDDIQRDLMDVLAGTAPAGRSDDRARHLEACPDCRRLAEDIEKILAGAAAEREDLRAAMAAVDWDALPDRIADAALGAERREAAPAGARSFRKDVFSRRWRSVFAAALAGILIGAAAMLAILRPQSFRRGGPAGLSASAASLDRVELGFARQDTIDYLDRSRNLILTLVQKSSDSTDFQFQGLMADRARDLLFKKRFLNPQLDRSQMAKARDICNQIELLFLELSQTSEEITAEEAARILQFVEQKQLLLKIKLLRKELSEREV